MAAISTMLAVGAVGLSAAGSYTQSKAAKKSAAANQAIAAEEAKQEAIRRQAAELDGRRKQLEIVRNQQRARSIALSTATAQGAGGGSGLQGGYGQIAGDTGNNLLGVTQNLALGASIFQSNQGISGQRGLLAGYQADMAFGQGLSSLGGTLMSNIGGLSNMFGGFGGASAGGMMSTGNSPASFANTTFGNGGIY